jgi:GDP-L-fucose synthase
MPDAELVHRIADGSFYDQGELDELYVACGKVGGISENTAKPGEFIHDNIYWPLLWLDVGRFAAKRILLFGSVCMYPRRAPVPHREEMLGFGDLEPTNSAYAVAKLCLLEAAYAYHKQYDTQVSYIIPSNLYGPGDKSTHAIPEIIAKVKRAKEHGEAPALYGDGTATREFLYVDDLARACQVVMTVPYDGPAPYNVGPGHVVTMGQVVTTVCRALDYEGPLSWGNGPNGAPARQLETSRISKLGWAPRVSLEEGLKELCAS